MTNLNLYTTKGIGVAPLDRALFNLVIYDLECTLSLPLLYTTASVITNLAHILEAWCNPKRSPSMFLLHAVALLLSCSNSNTPFSHDTHTNFLVFVF